MDFVYDKFSGLDNMIEKFNFSGSDLDQETPLMNALERTI